MILLTAMTTASCEKWRKKKEVDPERVFILYSAGFSNLSPSLTEDIQDLLSGDIPAKNSADVVLVISRKTSDASGRDYIKETAPYLFRVYRTKNKAVCDTLFALPAGSSLADADNMRAMLSKAAELFPVKHYGMVLSSHATGWVPAGYYASPNMYRSSSGPLRSSRIPAVDLDAADIALSVQGIQESRQRSHQCLTFTGFHLGNTSLMKDDTTNDLYRIMFHMKDSPGSFPDQSEGFGKQIIQRFPVCAALLQLSGLLPELLIGAGHQPVPVSFDFFHGRLQVLADPGAFRSK